MKCNLTFLKGFIAIDSYRKTKKKMLPGLVPPATSATIQTWTAMKCTTYYSRKAAGQSKSCWIYVAINKMQNAHSREVGETVVCRPVDKLPARKLCVSRLNFRRKPYFFSPGSTDWLPGRNQSWPGLKLSDRSPLFSHSTLVTRYRLSILKAT